MLAPSLSSQTPTINGFCGAPLGIEVTGFDLAKTGFSQVVMAAMAARFFAFSGFVQALLAL
jgi:hypothetical protein